MSDAALDPAETVSAPRRPLGPRVAAWVAGVLAALLALVAVAMVGIDTAPGHRLLIRLVEGQRQASGLTVRIGALDGSIYKRLTVRNLALGDGAGVFATSPAVTVDWRPGELLHKHVDMEALDADLVRVLRAPRLKPGPPPKPDQPTLPDIYLTLRRLRVGSLLLEPALTGDRRDVAIAGSVELLHGRARVDLAARALPVDGHAGGDTFAVKLDAEPGANRLAVDAHLRAPQGGVADRLAKLGGPLAFDLDGRGTWTAWNGRAISTLGGRPLLDAALTARAGTFSAKGTARPALVVRAPVAAALTAPQLAFDVSGKLSDRRLDASAKLGSDAFTLAAGGRFDLARSRYAGVVVDARLLRPEAAAPKLHGEDVRAHLLLDGPFARPVVDYDLAAARVGFDATVVEALHAHGRARVDADRTLRLPVHATAARVLGLPEAAGGLTTHVAVDGDVVVSPKQVASDNLHIRSDRLDATLVLALSLDTGRYDAALKGRIDRYAIEGLGVVDLVTDAKLVPTGRGQFRVAGHVHAATSRIDNRGALDFLGGQAVVDADFSRTPDGAFAVAGLHLSAPRFRITGGGGTFRTDGRITFAADALSAAYGPLKLEAGGTAKAPQVRLRAPDPKVGGITGLDLYLLGEGANRYRVTAAAASPYGPIAADVRLQTAPGPLSADVRRLSVGAITLAGQVRATAAGPFAGRLRLMGSGLNGAVTLAAVGRVQRADLALAAADARLPLTPAVTVARGVINATAVLHPGAPTVTGSATLSGVRQGGLEVAHARAGVELSGGVGRVTVSADGRSGVPFAIAAAAGISPELIRVTGEGSVNRIPIRLAGPADIRAEGSGRRLLPTTLLLPQGRVDVSGAFGKATSVQARLVNLDLSIAQAFAPQLGVNGRASGVVDATLPAGGSAIPTAHAQLQVTGFTRSGLVTVSEPIDLALLASLGEGGGDAHAIVRRRGAVIGRLQARLAPVPGGSGPWLKRLQGAPLSGGLRYDGPSEALWALSGVSGQEVSGPVAIGADVGGRLERPRITGVVRAAALRYENATVGTLIDQIAVDGRFTDTRFELAKLTARAGKGSVTGSGYAGLSAADGFPIDLKLHLADAQLARSDDVQATASGDLAVTNSRAKGALVSGDIRVDQARYAVVRQGASQVEDLAGVRRRGEPRGSVPTTAQAAAAATAGPPSVWKLDVRVHAGNRLFVSGMGLDAEWSSDLRISGDARRPQVVGDINLVHGVFSFAGRDLTLSRGVIRLNGSTPPDPVLDIVASTVVDTATLTINIGGSALRPQITLGSSPALPQDEVLSRLLFGQSVTQLSPLQAVQLAAALNSLRGSGGGLNPLGKLRQAAGIDRLKFSGADKTSGRGPSVGAGKYISSNIYVEVTTDARGFTATQIEIGLNKVLRLLSQVSSFGGSNISVRYSRDY